ncbi:MAG: SemiSWEET transporter [Chitinophagaceae bacterium]
MIPFVDVLGVAAGVVTTLIFLPQVIKTWREKSAKDISLLMFVIAAVNDVMWIVYGVLKSDMIITLTNSVVLVMALTMIYFKLTYKNIIRK